MVMLGFKNGGTTFPINQSPVSGANVWIGSPIEVRNDSGVVGQYKIDSAPAGSALGGPIGAPGATAVFTCDVHGGYLIGLYDASSGARLAQLGLSIPKNGVAMPPFGATADSTDAEGVVTYGNFRPIGAVALGWNSQIVHAIERTAPQLDAVVELSATSGDHLTVPLDSDTSSARMITFVGTYDYWGGDDGPRLVFPQGAGDDEPVTLVNNTRETLMFPAVSEIGNVSIGSQLLLPGDKRTLYWNGGQLEDRSVRGLAQVCAGNWFVITAAGNLSWFAERVSERMPLITKNGPGDHTVDFTANMPGRNIVAAHCTPNGNAATTASVQIVSATVVRVRMGADQDFTLTVIEGW